jgi:Domain of unknown function (DUF4157)
MPDHAITSVEPARANPVPSSRTAVGPTVHNAHGAHVAGNQAMQQLLRQGVIRAKLEISQPGDPLEQEADRMANQVISSPTPVRRCACGGVIGTGGECSQCKAKRLQRSASGPAPSEMPLSVSRVLNSSGRPLESGTRGFMESRFGHDFSDVQIHTGSDAAASAKSINAKAYTFGQNVVFGQGQYTPGSDQGKRLLAHELTHVIQQNDLITAPKIQRWRDGGEDPYEMAQHRRRMREMERERELHNSAWVEMHRSQHEGELALQTRSLRDDITNSELQAMQLRLEIFDRTLASGNRGTFSLSPGDTLTSDLREKLAQAIQATPVLTALLEVPEISVPAEIMAPISTAYLTYYAVLGNTMSALDAQERIFLEFRQRANGNLRTSHALQCPGGCHQEMPPISPPSILSTSNNSGAFAQPTVQSGSHPRLASIDTGPNMLRLTQAKMRLHMAITPANWRTVLEDFRWSTSLLDNLLRARLHQDESNAALIHEFEYTQELLERQQQMHSEHPDALKVNAIFYPKYEFTTRPDEQGVQREVAKGIPWQFYMTRSPAPDDGRAYAGYEWQLHDITAPIRENRTVRTRHQINALEAAIRQGDLARDPLPIDQMDPPAQLFQELNHKDFFAEGMLYWHYPLSGKPGQLETTASRTFGEWLTLIGIGLALLGSLVFAPFSIPMLLAVGVGTGLTIAGRVHRLGEMEEHDVLSQSDVNHFYWDLSLDIVNALTLGFGRIATISARAGNTLRATSAARAYFVVRRAQIAMDFVNVGVVTYDFVQQYRAIQNANMTPEQKQQALASLSMHAVLAGGLTFVQLRSGLHDFNNRSALSIDVDPSNPSLPIADFASTRAGTEPHVDTANSNINTARSRSQNQDRLLNESHHLESIENGLRFEHLDAEIDILRRSSRKASSIEGYVEEIHIGNGHVWRKRSLDGFWCRFSNTPSTCLSLGTGGIDAQGRVNVTEGDLIQMRSRYNIPPEIDTIALGRTDVPGLQERVFEGGSPRVRQQAAVLHTTQHVAAPSANPQKIEHGEEGVINGFIEAMRRSKISPAETEGKTLAIHISKSTGPCTTCTQGISNASVPPGIIQQLKILYPGLTIRVTWKTASGGFGSRVFD